MKTNNKYVLMTVYNAIQYDARVIRSAEAINNISENVIVISCNSDLSYENEKFNSLVYISKLKGPFLLIAFWIYVLRFSLNHKKNIKLLYVHDYYMVGIGKIISRLIKVKWVYDAHELVVDYRNNTSNMRSKFFSYVEKNSIGKANLVITANEERKRILRYIYKLKNVISVLNISPYTKTIQDDIAKDDIVVYQGVMSEGRNVSSLIQMLEYLPVHIKLKLIGDGPDLSTYKKMVNDKGFNERVVFTGKIPYSKLLEESRSSKVGIVVYKLDGLNNYYCSPNKIYEYAQLNIPMLMSSQPFLKGIVNKYNIGDIIYPSESIQDKAQKTLNIIKNYNTYANGMNAFLIDYSFENEMDRLKKEIANLLS